MAYVASITWTAKDGEEEAVADALRRLREPTLAEDGVIHWIAHRDPEDPRVFYVYEQYADEDAYAAHTETEHFKEIGFGDAIPRLQERRRLFYETLD